MQAMPPDPPPVEPIEYARPSPVVRPRAARALLGAGLLVSAAMVLLGVLGAWRLFDPIIPSSISWRSVLRSDVLLAPPVRQIAAHAPLAAACLACLLGRRWGRAVPITALLAIGVTLLPGAYLDLSYAVARSAATRGSVAGVFADPRAVRDLAAEAVRLVEPLVVPFALWWCGRTPAGREQFDGNGPIDATR